MRVLQDLAAFGTVAYVVASVVGGVGDGSDAVAFVAAEAVADADAGDEVVTDAARVVAVADLYGECVMVRAIAECVGKGVG